MASAPYLPAHVRSILSLPPGRSELQLAELVLCPDMPRLARAVLLPFSTRRLDSSIARRIRRWRERRKKKRCSAERASAEIAYLIDRSRRQHAVFAPHLALQWALAVIRFRALLKSRRKQRRETLARAEVLREAGISGEEERSVSLLEIARRASEDAYNVSSERKRRRVRSSRYKRFARGRRLSAAAEWQLSVDKLLEKSR